MKHKLQQKTDISAFVLHLLAMSFMVCDHMYRTVTPDLFWLTCIGRLAFPIFAYLTVEGYFHTHDLKRYLKRLLLLAVFSELPYNLLLSGSVFNPEAQNVVWTFLISLLCIDGIERALKSVKKTLVFFDVFFITISGFLFGFLLHTDYMGFGVLTVFAFYFFRGNHLWQRFGQVFSLFLINWALGGGLIFIPGTDLAFPYQSLAVFSLIFIWLYHGRQGAHNHMVRYINYLFYPAHILALILIAMVRQ